MLSDIVANFALEIKQQPTLKNNTTMTQTDYNTLETINYRGLTIKVKYDDDVESPRAWDNIGTMYTSCRNLKTDCDFYEHFVSTKVFSTQHGKMFKDSFLAKYIALPLYVYEHSGIAIQTTPFGDKWDSGIIGIIAVSMDKAREYYPDMDDSEIREAATQALQNEIEIFNEYLQGETYQYLIEELKHDDEFYYDSSMGGYYGYMGQLAAISDAKAVIDEYLKALETRKPKIDYMDKTYEILVDYIGRMYTSTKEIA